MSPPQPESVAPVLLPVEAVCPHPQNPRIFLNETTVSTIAASLRVLGSFPYAHAVLVRPLGPGVYQILSGHQRVAAATRADLKEVYAFVEVMTDEDAYRTLALTNNQTELTPLEKAIHSLGIRSARGQKGDGRGAWARSVGLDPAQLSRYRLGAGVLLAVRDTLNDDDVRACLRLPEHLSVIGHKSIDPTRWLPLVRQCLQESWTVSETRVRARTSAAEHSGRSPGERTPAAAPSAPYGDPSRTSVPVEPLPADPLPAATAPLEGLAPTPPQLPAREPAWVHSLVDDMTVAYARACHESAHAFFAFLLGRPLPRLDLDGADIVAPRERRHPHRRLDDDPFAIEPGIAFSDATARARIEDDVTLWLAGIRAEFAALPERLRQVREDPPSWGPDHDYVESLIDEFEGSSAARTNYSLYLTARTDDLVRQHWASITELADALRDRGTLTPEEIVELLEKRIPRDGARTRR